MIPTPFLYLITLSSELFSIPDVKCVVFPFDKSETHRGGVDS